MAVQKQLGTGICDAARSSRHAGRTARPRALVDPVRGGVTSPELRATKPAPAEERRREPVPTCWQPTKGRLRGPNSCWRPFVPPTRAPILDARASSHHCASGAPLNDFRPPSGQQLPSLWSGGDHRVTLRPKRARWNIYTRPSMDGERGARGTTRIHTQHASSTCLKVAPRGVESCLGSRNRATVLDATAVDDDKLFRSNTPASSKGIGTQPHTECHTEHTPLRAAQH